jgi:GNAT superfamily N-acetyltransferase
MITYESSSLIENKNHIDEYLDGISIPYDDFLEEHIFNSQIFSIFLDGEHIGFFGKLENMATIFFIKNEYFHMANEVFINIQMNFNITEAFVPTSDIGFMSVALEKFVSIEIQALHFTETNSVIRPPEFPKENFRLATGHDLREIELLARDFLDKNDERIRNNQIYVLEENNSIIGLGVLVENKIMRNCAGTGMFTKESLRRKGIGRSIIIHLKTIAHELGKTPVPGCRYYNTNSRKTLESAGYASKSKLLKFQF